MLDDGNSFIITAERIMGCKMRIRGKEAKVLYKVVHGRDAGYWKQDQIETEVSVERIARAQAEKELLLCGDDAEHVSISSDAG